MNDTVKAVIAAATAALVAAGAAIATDGISSAEWITIALAALAAFGGTEAVVKRQEAAQATERAEAAEAEVAILKKSKPDLPDKKK